MSDDTPTQRFDAQTPAGPEDDNSRSRLPLILGIIGGVLLIAVIVLVVLLLGKGSPSTTASNTDLPTATDSNGTVITPTPVPTVTVTETATPAPNTGGGGAAPEKPNGNNVLITKYAISPTVVDCSASAPAGSANLHIAWKSLNGNDAFFGVNTVDAQGGGMGWDLPTTGTNLDFPSNAGNPYTYQCGNTSESFTITVIGIGSKQSLTITVKRK